MANIYALKTNVPYGSVGKTEKLRLSAIFDFFQEAATAHAESLGVGREPMLSRNSVWIISRISVKAQRLPKYKEPITVRSWPQGFEKLFFTRYYDILDSDNKPIVQSRSAWLVFDFEKRRPLRPEQQNLPLPLNEGEVSLAKGAFALKASDGLEKIDTRRVRCSDIDSNNHVNNVRYIEWIQDAAEFDKINDAASVRLDMNYISERKYGDSVDILRAPIALSAHADADDNTGYTYAVAVEGVSSGNAAETVFRSELRIQ